VPPPGSAIFVIDPHRASSTGEQDTPRAPSDSTSAVRSSHIRYSSTLGWMHSNFGRRHFEDQPSVAGINRPKAENLREKLTISVGLLACTQRDGYQSSRTHTGRSGT
jgi:hypothetical protein